MSRLKDECSLKDTTILRNLILENPELPLMIFCNDQANSGEHHYELAYASKGDIEELTLYGDVWMDEDDYRESLADDLCDEEEYKNLSDKEFYEMIDQKVAETEFVKAIVIWVG